MVTVNIREICPGCGLCVGVCPLGAIQLLNGRARLIGDCVACELCVKHCPVGAIQIREEERSEV